MVARFQVFEPLQFALRFEHFGALLRHLLSHVRAVLVEGHGAVLDVRLEVR